MSLSQTLQLSIKNSVELRKARIDKAVVEQEIRKRRSAVLPQISGRVQMDYYPQLPTVFWPGELFGGDEGTFIPVQVNQPWQSGAVVEVEQVLYDEVALRMAPAKNLSRQLADLMVQRTEEEVIFHTATLFYKILQTEQLLKGVGENLEKLGELERIAQLQLENGFAIPTDVKRIKVAITNMKTQQNHLVAADDILKQNLQFICNLPLDQPLELQWGGETPVTDSAQWQGIAFDLNSITEFHMLENQMELHRIQSRSFYGEGFPKLSAYGILGVQAQRTDANFFTNANEWYGLGGLGFKLNVSIFDGFLHRRKSNILKLQGQKLDLESRQVARAKELEFNQAYSQYRNALNMLHTQEENVALAQDITDKLFLQYREGEASLTDLLNAQTAASEAEAHYWSQLFDYKLAVLKLLKSAGRLEELM